ncbi:hypothetical protein, partial [Comamonas resistens]|uniref:hypothetical protein n=1 Tax=Comamonas resistens TaxID=3046670 RepID=UPI0039BC2D1B
VRVSGGHLCNLPGVQALHFGVETAVYIYFADRIINTKTAGSLPASVGKGTAISCRFAKS